MRFLQPHLRLQPFLSPHRSSQEAFIFPGMLGPSLESSGGAPGLCHGDEGVDRLRLQVMPESGTFK